MKEPCGMKLMMPFYLWLHMYMSPFGNKKEAFQGPFTLRVRKMHQMFSVRATPKKFKNETISDTLHLSLS